jgi:hypothetical protein
VRAYGARDSYTVEEIRAVVRQWEMRMRYPAYAFALFATRGEFERLGDEIRRGRDYEQWRSDILRHYRRLPDLQLSSIAMFARNRWYHLSDARSNVPLPDSFERTPPD